MKNQSIPLLAVGLILAAAPVFPQAEKKPSAAQIPQAVRNAVVSRLPGAKITSYSLETENGARFYEVGCVAAGRRHDLTVTPEGIVREDEETIPLSEIPSAVRSSLAKAFPGAQIARAEKITAGQEVKYELSLKKSSIKEAVFAPDGELISSK